MTMLRELDERQIGISRSQNINSIVIMVVAVGMMLVGLLMRNSAVSATQPFLDEESGIRAQIPANWLIDHDNTAFIFEASDPNAVPFKTVLRVALLTVGAEATSGSVANELILRRNVQLSNFRSLSIQSTTLNEQSALELNYAYVQTEPNPFLNSIPIVVQGRDMVVVRGQQALVITYLEERSRFRENQFLFDNFLAGLEF